MPVIRGAIVCCALIALSAGLAGASSPPSAVQILAQAKTAAGGSALDRIDTLQLTERVEVMGAAGTGHEYDDVTDGRFAQVMDLGPISNGNGFDGSRAWIQDPSGDAWPVGDFTSTHAALSAAYLTSLSFWYPNRRPGTTTYAGTAQDALGTYWVVRATPVGGFPIDIWIDTQTKLIRREVVRVPGGRDSVADMSDYRHVGDIVLPFSTRTTANGNIVATRISAVAINTDIAHHIAMPATPVADFSIAGGRTTTTIPFDLINNHLYVNVRLDGKGPFRFIFDTGGQNVMTPDVAATLGSGVTGSLQMSGAGAETVSTGFAWVPTLSIGTATLRHQSFAVLPIGKIMQAVEGERIDGIVGVEIARRFITTIDYPARTMTFATRMPDEQPGTAIPFVYDQSVPEISGAVGALRGQFIIDTGNRQSLVLYAPFVTAHDLTARYPSDVHGITGFGLGGPSVGQLVRLPSFVAGTVTVADPIAALSLDTAGALTEPGTAGNIGGGILKRFTVTFDYRRQIMYLARGRAGPTADSFDRSGLFLVQTHAGIRVIGALTGTPAYAAGIRSGDVITAVNGRPAASIGLLDLRAQLRTSPGTRIEMMVRDGTSDKKVTFTLRDYV
jgi:aspartyl protease/PDZ domain-containing protein